MTKRRRGSAFARSSTALTRGGATKPRRIDSVALQGHSEGEGMASVDLFDLPAFAPEHRGGPRECADKLLSEAAEAFGEIRGYEPLARWGVGCDAHREAVALEIADVLQVCRNICEVCEISPDMMAAAMTACVDKNRAKDGGRYGQA